MWIQDFTVVGWEEEEDMVVGIAGGRRGWA